MAMFKTKEKASQCFETKRQMAIMACWSGSASRNCCAAESLSTAFYFSCLLRNEAAMGQSRTN